MPRCAARTRWIICSRLSSQRGSGPAGRRSFLAVPVAVSFWLLTASWSRCWKAWKLHMLTCTGEARQYSLGWRFGPAGQGFELSVAATLHESVNDNDPERGTGFRFMARWQPLRVREVAGCRRARPASCGWRFPKRFLLGRGHSLILRRVFRRSGRAGRRISARHCRGRRYRAVSGDGAQTSDYRCLFVSARKVRFHG